jgi:predicted patatin/cPLA2 family phospholipase
MEINNPPNDDILSDTLIHTDNNELLTENIPEPKKKYKNLVISGGGSKAICHLGSLSKLWEDDLIDLQECAASSAGSMIGCLLVIGFTPREIWQFILNIDMSKFIKIDISLLIPECGINRGEIIINVMNELLTKKTGIPNINFLQLYERTKITFTVVGTCLTDKKSIYYNHLLTPDFAVVNAIRISVGVPGLFTPYVIDGKSYIDGGVLDHYPMHLFKDREDETIGSLIYDDYNTNYTCPEQYMFALYNIFMHSCQERYCYLNEKNTIYITPETSSSVDFSMTNDVKQKYFDVGYQSKKGYKKHMKMYEIHYN